MEYGTQHVALRILKIMELDLHKVQQISKGKHLENHPRDNYDIKSPIAMASEQSLQQANGLEQKKSNKTRITKNQTTLMLSKDYTPNAVVKLLPHCHCVGANLTAPWRHFRALLKPIWIWPITDAVLSCSLTDSDVADHGAD